MTALQKKADIYFDIDIKTKHIENTNVDIDNAKAFLKFYSSKPMFDVTTGRRFSTKEDEDDIEIGNDEE